MVSVSQEGNHNNVNSEGVQILIEACTHLRTSVRDTRDKIAKFEAICLPNASSTRLTPECDRLISRIESVLRNSQSTAAAMAVLCNQYAETVLKFLPATGSVDLSQIRIELNVLIEDLRKTASNPISRNGSAVAHTVFQELQAYLEKVEALAKKVGTTKPEAQMLVNQVASMTKELHRWIPYSDENVIKEKLSLIDIILALFCFRAGSGHEVAKRAHAPVVALDSPWSTMQEMRIDHNNLERKLAVLSSIPQCLMRDMMALRDAFNKSSSDETSKTLSRYGNASSLAGNLGIVLDYYAHQSFSSRQEVVKAEM